MKYKTTFQINLHNSSRLIRYFATISITNHRMVSIASLNTFGAINYKAKILKKADI